MRKKYLLPIVLLAGILCLTACGGSANEGQDPDAGSQEEQDAQADSEEEQEEKEDENAGSAEGMQDDSEDEDGDMTEQPPEPGSAYIKIYYSNDDATGFTSENVRLSSLAPEEVLEALVDSGSIAADIKILSFTTTTIEKKATLELDFNSAFATYLSNMGSSGEYYIIGSICNTFLDAYGCEQIKITVEGEDLSTGHAEYPGYLTTFE